MLARFFVYIELHQSNNNVSEVPQRKNFFLQISSFNPCTFWVALQHGQLSMWFFAHFNYVVAPHLFQV